ncbi:hypothetical protein IV498_01565 [Paenarthrobacter sp. Z7-10]|uniref:hypothetical protein n=1 Tax=Paenarthrobacter sp. Z7-10 TaxID=2787635 RepID=UPI0022A9227F|nr:hypothetical protein [Paenarthrobacter sp. Z7-10]MCZ2401903.1 hypothetical protein [Paenarthrobacter sp. Z7-10]
MPLNRSGTRADLRYLRRRVKSVPSSPQPSAASQPDQTRPVAEPSAKSPGAGLSLSRPQNSSPAADTGTSTGAGLSLSRPQNSSPAADTGTSTGAGLSLSRPQNSSPAADTGRSTGAGLSLSRTPPGATSPGTRPHAPASNSGMNPAAASDTVLNGRADTSAGRLFPAPGIAEVKQLDGAHPVIRLNARQSAVGSLIITGTSALVWEGSDFTTGALTVDGSFAGTPIDTSGHRPLVGYVEADAVVALRHVRDLRRALFIGRGPQPLGVQLFDGATASVAAPNHDGMFVLALLQVGGLLELRAEAVPADSPDAALWQEFGYTMTARAARQRNRS